MSLLLMSPPLKSSFADHLVFLDTFNRTQAEAPLVGGPLNYNAASFPVVDFPEEGSKALYINGTGGTIATTNASTNFYLGNAFNIEFDLMMPSLPPASIAYGWLRPLIIGTNNTATGYTIQVSSDGKLAAGVPLTGRTGLLSQSSLVVAGQWAKFAFSQYEGMMRIFKNGQLISQGLCDVQAAGSVRLRVGYDPDPPVNGRHPFYMRNLRILKGSPGHLTDYVPVYSDYTPQTT